MVQVLGYRQEQEELEADDALRQVPLLLQPESTEILAAAHYTVGRGVADAATGGARGDQKARFISLSET